MNDFPQIIYKRHTFLSALAMGVSAIIIAFIVSCTVVIIYGMNFAGEKSEELVTLAEEAIRGLPKLRQSLPPVFADVLNDRRQPDYATQLGITANTILLPADKGTVKTTIEVVNNGSEVVSLLSLRVVVLTSRNEIVTESNEWAATPIAADEEWRGPLMPGSRRYFVTHRGGLPVFSADELKTEIEITDIRIWNSEKGTWIENRKSPAAELPDPNAAKPAPAGIP
jgi:hypothetical protein